MVAAWFSGAQGLAKKRQTHVHVAQSAALHTVPGIHKTCPCGFGEEARRKTVPSSEISEDS